MLMPMDSDRLQTERVENAVLPMAEVALETGQLETAKRLYQRLLDVDPESVSARMGLGEIAFRRGDSVDAARWHLSAVAYAEQPEQRHAALLAHGRAALDAGQLEAARNSFAQLADPKEEAPSDSVAWGLNGVGLTLLLEGDLRGAIAKMEQAVQRAPSEAVFQENLDRALAMFAEFDQADLAAADQEGAADAESAPASPAEPTTAGSPSAASTARSGADDLRESQPTERQASPPTLDPLPASTSWSVRSDATDEDKAEEFGGFVVHADGQQFVQMGAYRHRSTALTLAALLRDAIGQPVRVVEQPALHRVRIGPIASRQALMALLDDLRKAGYGAVRLPSSMRQDGSAQPAAQQEAPKEAPRTEKDAPATDASPLFPSGQEAQALVVVEDGSRFLQFGAYKARDSAEKLASRLRELLGSPVLVSEAQVGDALVHRVRSGPIESEDALRSLVDAAEGIGFEVD